MSEKHHPIPRGWTWTRLRDVCTTTSGGTPLRSKKQYYGGKVAWLKSGELQDDVITSTEENITELGLQNSSAKIFPEGTLLIALYGATVGKTGILGIPAATNQAVCAIFNEDSVIDKMYLLFYLRHKRSELINRSFGGAQPNISQEIVRNLELAFPPLGEQKRIVVKIEELMHPLKTARESLQRIPSLARRFSQSVLSAAFLGRLTERDPKDELASVLLERIGQERRKKWEEGLRARGKDPKKYKYEEPEPVDVRGLEELPRGWAWATLGTLLELVQYGTSVKASDRGVPTLRMGNIKEGKLDFSNLKYTDPRDEDIPKYELKLGDILINRTNSPELVGKCALFNTKGKYIFASYLIRLRAMKTAASPMYLTFLINSPIGRRHIDTVKHQVAGQSNINTHDIECMPIPLAPLQEQFRVAERIQQFFAHGDQAQESVKGALKNAEALERSVLAKAFRGRLVPQDRSDEPASVLLEKIRAHRATMSKKENPRPFWS